MREDRQRGTPKPAQSRSDHHARPFGIEHFHTMTRTAHTSRLGLTTSEAARHLGVSLSTVRRWSDMGYLRGYRTPGGQRRFPVTELDEFVSSLEARSRATSPPPRHRFDREHDAPQQF
jgi:excisionase family DNA binding protein